MRGFSIHNQALRRLLFGASGAFFLSLIGMGLTFLLHLLLASSMGPAQYGIYVYILSWLSIAILIALLGRETASLRYIASYVATGSWDLLAGFISSSRKAVILRSAIIASIALLFILVFKEQIEKEFLLSAFAACILLPFWSAFQLTEGFIKAFKHIAKALSLSKALYPLLIIGSILLWRQTIDTNLLAHQALLIIFIVIAILLAIGIAMLRKIRPGELSAISKYDDKTEWNKVSLTFFTISLFQIILSKTDIIMIGSIVGSHETGIYAAAARVALLIGLAITSVNAILAPTISELYTKNDREQLQSVLIGASQLILVFAVPVVIFLVVFGEWVLSLFGEPFTAGYMVLVTLSLGQLTISLLGSVGFLMTMTGFQKEAARVIGGTAVLNIILNAIFIPLWGMLGAAIATTLSVVLRSSVLYRLVRLRLNVFPSVLLLNSFTKAFLRNRA